MAKHHQKIQFNRQNLKQPLTVLTFYLFSMCLFSSSLVAQDSVLEAKKPNVVKEPNENEPLIAPKPLSRPAKSKAEIKRDLLVFDLNRDGRLDLSERKNIPSEFPITQRGKLPDPIVKLAEKRFTNLKKEWNNWDLNRDSKLDQAEFAKSSITNTVPGLSDTKFEDWDQNQDHFVDLADCHKLLEIAYAIRHPSGVRLRSDTGLAVNWYYFKYLDTDSDRLITFEELQKRGYDGDKAKARFQKADADQNGKLTLAEWVTGSYRWIDPVSSFLRQDKNRDGQISQEELLTSTSSWELPVAKHYFPGFDINRNGTLSLMEFLDSPLAVPIVRWPVPRQDTNKDGYLSVDEFRWESGILQSAILAEYFHRLDLNQDHKLGMNEFFFNTDKRTPAGDFQKHDQNGDQFLTELEFLKLFSSERQQLGKQQFIVFDLNKDNQLSFAEFLLSPTFTPIQERGKLPNPIVDLIKKQMQEITKNWPKFDQDKNGLINQQEFQASDLGKTIPALSGLTSKEWDRNQDGNITQAECQSLIEIAYGIRLPDETVIRAKSGRVLRWNYYKQLDKDRNYKINLEELTKYGYDGKQAKVRFQNADTDKNGELTLTEWQKDYFRWIDPTLLYLKLDKDFSGSIDQQELLANISAFELPIARHYFPGFDTDGDGLLSLVEYADSPLANFNYVWPRLFQDLNNNGYLELAEFKWKPVKGESDYFAIARLKEYFQRFDVNKDNKLDLDEFTFNTSKRTPAGDFRKYDLDKDQSLTKQEFLKRFSPERQQMGKQQFIVFDLNKDNKLSFAEYLLSPTFTPVEERGELPSTIVESIKKQMQEITKNWSEFDRDKNGLLDHSEFQASDLGRTIPALSMLTSREWDQNQDGNITQAECQALIEIAYGIRLPDNTMLRAKSGRVLNWVLHKQLDKDRNNKINLEELTKYGYDGKQAEVRFQAADTDKNGELTLTEWIKPSYRWIDPTLSYLKRDKDFSGSIDQQELLANASAWESPVAKHYFPGFDTDGDGLLSLVEYADSPLANFIFVWPRLPQDLNNNGYLELDEFKWTSIKSEPDYFATALLQKYFNRFDVNNDNKLDLDEYTFRIHPYKTPRHILFKSKDIDKNGGLTFEEIVGEIKPGADEKAQIQQEKYLARIEAAFRKSDRNRDNELSNEEFRSESVLEIIAPQLVKRERNRSSALVTRSPTQNTNQDDPMWIILGLNALLLVGVFVFLIRKTNLFGTRSK